MIKPLCTGLLALLAATACGKEPPALPVDRPEPRPTRIGIVPPAGPYQPGIDALHYAITIELPDTGNYVMAVTRVDALVRERLDTMWLDITGMRVRSVTRQVRNDKEEPAWFRQDSARVYFGLSNARAGDTVRVTLHYDGHPDDGLIIRKNVHGAWGAFADNWPDRARFWFPNIDHPSDKATVEFLVTAPENWEVVANGKLGRVIGPATDLRARKRSWEWRIDQPIPTYLMVIGATDFAMGTVDPCANGGAGCVPVRYYAFPPDSVNNANVFRRAGQMVTHFAQLIAPFPYPELAHVQSATRFGGMENAGAIFYSEQALRSGSLGEGTVSHEIAHQWFGDAVTPAHWSHVWLSEGFATYFGNQFFERADGVQRFRELTQNSWRGYLQSRVTDLAIVDTTAVPGNDLLQLLNANSYNKGGAVLHMLRGILGDEIFFNAIRRYYRRHLHGNARTADLQRAVEEESGRDLGWFFQQWVYRPGHPILTSNIAASTGGEAVITIRQVQKDSWPTFRFPLDIALTIGGGEIRQRVQVTQREQTFRLPVASTPSAIRLDPDGWLLHEIR